MKLTCAYEGEEIGLAVERLLPKTCHRRQVLRMGLSHYGVEAMPKSESFPIDKIYVPVKRKKALKPELVQEIAEVAVVIDCPLGRDHR